MKTKSSTQVFSFTTFSNGGLLRSLETEIFVEHPHGMTGPIPGPTGPKFKAIWDTGATNSVISTSVVQSKKFVPIGMKEVHGVHGVEPCNTYLVSLYLPNRICLNEIEVTEGNLGSIDILIGMDVISQGDFVVTNLGGRTMFSFRCPSTQRIDFVKWKPKQDHGCMCGSGKSYKNCCMPFLAIQAGQPKK